MKAAKDRGEEFYDPERKDKILGRNKTRLELWEEHLKDPIVALDKALKCVESSSWSVSRPETLWWERSTMAGVGFLQSLWKKKADLGGRLALTDMLFNAIYNKTKSTTRSVRRQCK